MKLKLKLKYGKRGRKYRKKRFRKSKAKRVIMRTAETKLCSYEYGVSGFNRGINSVGDVIDCIPALTQGTSQKQRIGNRVTPVKLVIRGYIAYDTGSIVYPSHLGVRLFCYSDRGNPSSSDAAVNYNLINEGGTSRTFTGSPIDFDCPHNNDQFRFYKDMRFRMFKPYGLTGSLVTAMTDPGINLYKPFKIVIKKFPRELRYDQAESLNYPVNFLPRMSLGFCDLNGGEPSGVEIKMTFISTLYYKDF